MYGFSPPLTGAPAYTTIRGILRQLEPASVEVVFRRNAATLNDVAAVQGQRHVAIDGKTVRRSLDDFLNRRAAGTLSAFASDTTPVLTHLDCDEKSNELSRPCRPWSAHLRSATP